MGWGSPGPFSPAPSPAAAAKVQVRPRAAVSEAACASQRLPFEGEEGSEVIRVRGHSTTHCAITWEKSLQLCLWGFPVSPSGVEARSLACTPFPVASSRAPLPGKPPWPFFEISPSLRAQVAQQEHPGGLARRPGRLWRAWGRGSRDKCPKEVAGVGRGAGSTELTGDSGTHASPG